MKTKRSLFWFFGVLIFFVTVSDQPLRAQDTTSLTRAISKGLVTARFSGTGASSGDAICVTVQKTGKAGPGPLVLTIPSGTILRSSNRSEQDMVISTVRGRAVDSRRFTPQSQIVVLGATPVTYILEAYCAEFHKGNPSPSNVFRIQAPDPILSCILLAGKKRNLSVQAIQAAVWIVTDNLTYVSMNTRLPISHPDWQSAKAIADLCQAEVKKSASSSQVTLPKVTEGNYQRRLISETERGEVSQENGISHPDHPFTPRQLSGQEVDRVSEKLAQALSYPSGGPHAILYRKSQ